MRLSSIITPFRIYSEFHDQDRFKKDCNNFCEYELITDKEALLPFQFSRDASIFPFTKIWMRPTCTNFMNKIIPNNQANFISGSAGWELVDCTATSHNAKLTQTAGGYIKTGDILTTGKRYVIKINVVERKRTGTSTLSIVVTNGITSLYSITATGSYEIPFTCGLFNYVSITSTIAAANDYCTISYFQIEEIIDYDVDLNDYLLPSDFVSIVNKGSEDLIVYCGAKFTNTLPCGKYYLIFQSKDSSGNAEYFFSEVFFVKNFIQSQSPYVKLTWLNSCDLQDVKFTGLGEECTYENRLYIDGPVTKPEYPFTEEGQEDGEQNFNPTFQKWEKKEIIIIPKAPEFIVDAVTCIKLHDTITFTEPIREEQPSLSDSEAVSVKSLQYDVNYIFLDCAANVELKLMLEDNIVDSACCQTITTETQPCCDFSVASVGDYNIDMPEPAVALALSDDLTLTFYKLNYDTDLWEAVNPMLIEPNTIVCCSESSEFYYWNGSSWIQFPILSGMSNYGAGFTLVGAIHPNTVCKITVTYLGVTYVLPGVYSSTELATGIDIDYADIPVTLQNFSTITATVNCYNAYCDYGDSNTLNITFGD